MIYFIQTKAKLSVPTVLSGVFLGSSRYHMYFITVLIFFCLIYPFVYMWFSQTLGFVIAAVISVIGQVVFLAGSTFEVHYFLNFLVYFALGIYLAKRDRMKKLVRHANVSVAIGILVVLSTSIYFKYFTDRSQSLVTTSMRPAVFLLSIGMVAFAMKHLSKPTKFLSLVDRQSLNIYYVHPIMLMVIQKLLQESPLPSLLLFIIITSFVICASIIFAIPYSCTIKKIPILRNVF
ncbi:hypothetical protein Lpla01_01923 [Lactiplantibacillus plajomi]